MTEGVIIEIIAAVVSIVAILAEGRKTRKANKVDTKEIVDASTEKLTLDNKGR